MKDVAIFQAYSINGKKDEKCYIIEYASNLVFACKQLLSKMKRIKFRTRSQLTGDRLQFAILLSVCSIKPDFNALVTSKQQLDTGYLWSTAMSVQPGYNQGK